MQVINLIDNIVDTLTGCQHRRWMDSRGHSREREREREERIPTSLHSCASIFANEFAGKHIGRLYSQGWLYTSQCLAIKYLAMAFKYLMRPQLKSYYDTYTLLCSYINACLFEELSADWHSNYAEIWKGKTGREGGERRERYSYVV